MAVESTVNGVDKTLSPQVVPLRTGPPTREELIVYYPHKFTWTQLKTFVNSGDLGLLKRDRKLQQRYDAWAKGIREQYGSMVDYLLNHRLQWGKRDTLSMLPSALDGQISSDCAPGPQQIAPSKNTQALPPISKDAPRYFKSDIPFDSELLSIIQNDWPYSVPPNIEHTLIWTRVPIFHPDLVPEAIVSRIEQDGLCGFTGSDEPPPSPSTLPQCLPALADWGVTMDKLVRSPKESPEQEEMVRNAGKEVAGFVKRRWNEAEWETAWFVNPPRLQSVPGLAHIHVFARKK